MFTDKTVLYKDPEEMFEKKIREIRIHVIQTKNALL